MLNIGIIGFGKMGQTRARAIQEDGKGEVVAVYDANHDADYCDFHRADSADEIIAHQADFIGWGIRPPVQVPSEA